MVVWVEEKYVVIILATKWECLWLGVVGNWVYVWVYEGRELGEEKN